MAYISNIRSTSIRRAVVAAGRLATCLLIVAAWLPASASDALPLGGVEGGHATSYAYLGTILPTPGSELGNGIVQKYWIDRLTYSYKSNNQDVDASAYGLEGAVGYQKVGSGGWGGAYLGLRYQDTKLSPDNPDSQVRGGQFRVKAQLEGQQDFSGGWRVGALTSYVFGNRSYWARLQLQHRLPNGWYLGPEVVAQGDPDYRGRAAAAALSGIPIGEKTFLGFRVGAKKIAGESREVFGAVELGTSY